jgi:hypothetical protein
VLSLAIPIIYLRGNVRPQTVEQVDGLQHIVSINAVSEGTVLWSENFTKQTVWSVSRDITTQAQLAVDGSLSLTVNFSGAPNPQAASVSRNVGISLDQDPIIKANITLPKGVSYGMRLFGITPDGTNFVAWNEASSLQHRPGTGSQESISANLLLESYAANQQFPPQGSKITRISFYVEAVSGTERTFILKISALASYALEDNTLGSRQASGNFNGLRINLGSMQTNLSLFQVFLGYDIKGTTDLLYTPYFTQGMGVVAKGFAYAPKSTTTYELAVLTPPSIPLASPLPIQTNSSTIIVNAQAGKITYFQLDSISIRLDSQVPAFEGTVDPSFAQLLSIYYLAFLFVVPTATILLLDRVFRHED